MLTDNEILEILEQCCGRTLGLDSELVQSGLLDSLGTVLLAEALEARGVPVSVARLPKSTLATPRALAAWLRAGAPPQEQHKLTWP